MKRIVEAILNCALRFTTSPIRRYSRRLATFPICYFECKRVISTLPRKSDNLSRRELLSSVARYTPKFLGRLFHSAHNLTSCIAISPTIDITFKKIFCVEDNKDLLKSFVNSILGEEDQVAEITLLDTYDPANLNLDNMSILGIKAVGLDGKRIRIEIQLSNEGDYRDRALCSWAKIYREQLTTSKDYSKLCKVIVIDILGICSIQKTTKYHNVFHITEKSSRQVYFQDLEIHTIELRKFKGSSNEGLSDIVAKVKNTLDMWMTFLTSNNLLKADNLPVELDNPYLKKAIKVCQVMNFTTDEKDIYENHLKFLRMEYSTVKKIKEEGRIEGLLNVAKEMLKENESIEYIMKYSKLKKEVLEELKKMIN